MRLIPTSPLLIGLTLLSAVAATGLQAKTSDRNQPMDVAADHTDAGLGDDSDSTLSGNVRITQGTLEVDADVAVIHRKKGDIDNVVLNGQPVVLKQTADNGDPMTARASKIVYTLSNDQMLLTGNVQVEQPRDHVGIERAHLGRVIRRCDHRQAGGMIGRHHLQQLPVEPVRARLRAARIAEPADEIDRRGVEAACEREALLPLAIAVDAHLGRARGTETRVEIVIG